MLQGYQLLYANTDLCPRLALLARLADRAVQGEPRVEKRRGIVTKVEGVALRMKPRSAQGVCWQHVGQ